MRLLENEYFSVRFYLLYLVPCLASCAQGKYENTNGWNKFKNIVEIVKQCDKPSICYENGNLYFTCETEGAEYVTKIKDSDVKIHHDSMISLTATYNISVYATKEGYDNSETAIATLCWIDAEPIAEGTKEADGLKSVLRAVTPAPISTKLFASSTDWILLLAALCESLIIHPPFD